MGLLTEIQNDISGAQALADWLGGEPPVGDMRATLRAALCVEGNKGQPCPLNVEPCWWERNFKNPIARWITRELEEKSRLKLETQFDDRLHICKACGCCLRLKVWTPPKVVRAHVTEKQLSQTPTYCWMRKELL